MAEIPPTDPGGDDHERKLAELKSRRAELSMTQQMFALSGVGFEFITAVGAFAAIGWWLDKRFDKSPALTLVGLAIGFSLGLYRLIRFGMSMNRTP